MSQGVESAAMDTQIRCSAGEEESEYHCREEIQEGSLEEHHPAE